MKKHPACYPCLIRGTHDVACLATGDEAIQRQILQEVMVYLAGADPDDPPPLGARFIQETVTRLAGCFDPYGPIKKEYNEAALALYPELSDLKDKAKDRFDAGVRLAIAGNIIDLGVASTLGLNELKETITHGMETRVKGRIEDLKQAVAGATRILWIGDNAGEIVFDRLLLEEMDCTKVIYGVRGGAVQNDATMDDAIATGLTRMVKVIDSGAVIPGTLLAYCSEQFLDAYNSADLIIAKGQGNFETLDHGDPRIFSLFKAKCPVVAGCGDWDLGDVVVKGPYN